MNWLQSTITVRTPKRGCHEITRTIESSLPELAEVNIGMLHLFIQHTSAAITINENADPDVLIDLEMAMSSLVPTTLPYRHTAEGEDDMPAHVKASLIGNSLTIPIQKGCLLLGTWQGIYLWELRDHSSDRHIVATIQGSKI